MINLKRMVIDMNELKICGYMRKYQVCREYAIERIKWEEGLRYIKTQAFNKELEEVFLNKIITGYVQTIEEEENEK